MTKEEIAYKIEQIAHNGATGGINAAYVEREAEKLSKKIIKEFTKEESTLMEFESSNGTLLVNKDGSINEKSDFDNDSWLSDISKVDIEELENYYNLQGEEIYECGDVLDFGWWDKKGNYNKPERNWRKETFHKQELDEEQVESILNISFKWITDNRIGF